MKILKDLCFYTFVMIIFFIIMVGAMPWCIYSAYVNNSDVVNEPCKVADTLTDKFS